MPLRRKIKNSVGRYSRAELLVREATSNDPTLPSQELLLQISNMTKLLSLYEGTIRMIFKRLNDKSKNWRHIYKALVVIEACLQHGSIRFIKDCRSQLPQMKTLSDFVYSYDQNPNAGFLIREKARRVVALLEDASLLEQERLAARTDHSRGKSLYGRFRENSGIANEGEIADPSHSRRANSAYDPSDEYFAQNDAEEREQIRLAKILSLKETSRKPSVNSINNSKPTLLESSKGANKIQSENLLCFDTPPSKSGQYDNWLESCIRRLSSVSTSEPLTPSSIESGPSLNEKRSNTSAQIPPPPLSAANGIKSNVLNDVKGPGSSRLMINYFLIVTVTHNLQAPGAAPIPPTAAPAPAPILPTAAPAPPIPAATPPTADPTPVIAPPMPVAVPPIACPIPATDPPDLWPSGFVGTVYSTPLLALCLPPRAFCVPRALFGLRSHQTLSSAGALDSFNATTSPKFPQFSTTEPLTTVSIYKTSADEYFESLAKERRASSMHSASTNFKKPVAKISTVGAADSERPGDGSKHKESTIMGSKLCAMLSEHRDLVDLDNIITVQKPPSTPNALAIFGAGQLVQSETRSKPSLTELRGSTKSVFNWDSFAQPASTNQQTELSPSYQSFASGSSFQQPMKYNQSWWLLGDQSENGNLFTLTNSIPAANTNPFL
ncbi:hypothetical protein Aperf_G00000124013 [Anoplocephala perfoliata]